MYDWNEQLRGIKNPAGSDSIIIITINDALRMRIWLASVARMMDGGVECINRD